MREVNLLNFYMVKTAEVVCLLACTVAMLVSTLAIADFGYAE